MGRRLPAAAARSKAPAMVAMKRSTRSSNCACWLTTASSCGISSSVDAIAASVCSCKSSISSQATATKRSTLLGKW
jgi:hypothetical protein